LRPRDPDTRHTNVNLTYSSGHGGRRDMMMIAFNHRGFAADGPQPGGIAVGVFEVESRGEVRLVSADPAVDPFVDCNMLDAERDRLRLRDGVRRLAAIVAAAPVRSIAERIGFGASGIAVAAAAALPDRELDALMLAEAGDGQHAAGTCRMTSFGAGVGVTDPDGRVKGLDGLFVADASLMPFDCRANTHFTTMMIGEAIAARLLERAGPAQRSEVPHQPPPASRKRTSRPLCSSHSASHGAARPARRLSGRTGRSLWIASCAARSR
jgi:choline dehydrogenase